MDFTANSYNCPSCSAPIQYDGKEEKFVCQYCSSTFSIAEIEKYHAEKLRRDTLRAEKKTGIQEEKRSEESSEDKSLRLNEYSCQNCGAHVVTTDTTSSTFCYYCHSPVVLISRLQGDFKPDQILPFQITEEQAKQGFLNWAKTKKYIPDDFVSESHMEKMTGMYIPYWFADSKLSVDFEGSSKSSKSWRQGDYQYTRTQDLVHLRNGSFEINDVSLQAFSKIDANLLNGIEPFDGDQFIPFSLPVLQGYFAEQYTMSEEEAKGPMHENVGRIAESLLNSSLNNASSIQVHKKEIKGEASDLLFSLLPVWVLTYNYLGKIYVYAMNGQNGRAFGELPIVEEKLKADARKRAATMAFFFALILTVVFAFFFMF